MAKVKAKKKRGPGTRRISAEFYEGLVEAFRANPGNITAAAKAVGTSRPTAKRGWLRGWEKFDWAPPIQDVIANEQEIARARIEDEKEAEQVREELINPVGGIAAVAEQRREAHLKAQSDRAKARENAIQARVEQGKMIAGVRQLVMQCEALIGKRFQGASELADRINKEMRKLAKASDKEFNLTKATQLLRLHNADVRSVSQSAKRAFELEQVHLGEPSQIVGVQTTHFDDADEETLKKEIRKALEAMDDYGDDSTVVEAGEAEVVRH